MASDLGDALDAVADDFHVGQQEVFVERGEIGQRIAAVEGGEDQDEAAGLAQRRQPAGAARVVAAQARGIGDLDGGAGDFFGVVDFGQGVDAGLGDFGHGRLSDVPKRGVGRDAGEPREQRAPAGTLVSDQTDFHGRGFRWWAASSSANACSTTSRAKCPGGAARTGRGRTR